MTIGSRANDNVNISAVAGAGPYIVTLASPPAASTIVGDVLSDEAASPNIYLITEINGSDLTVRDAFSAAVAPSAAGSSQAFTRRAYADYSATLNTALDSTTIFSSGDTADLRQCEEITVSSYTYPGQPQKISGGGTVGLTKIRVHGHTNYRFAGGQEQAGDAGIKDTDGRNVCLFVDTPVTTEIYDLVFTKAGTSYNENYLVQHSHLTSTCEIHHCIVVGNGLACAAPTFYLRGISGHGTAGTGTLIVHNCVLRNIKNATSMDGTGIVLGANYGKAFANTIYDCQLRGIIGVDQHIARDNLVMGTGTADYYNSAAWSSSSDYNLSEDATAPGANSQINKVVADVLVDANNGDLHITDSGAAYRNGENLTGLATDIQFDLDKQGRAAPWDIGADYIPTPPQAFAAYQEEWEMHPRQADSSTYPILFRMKAASDHVTGLTGLSPTVQIAKSGGSFAAPAGAVTEIGLGWYQWAGNATDRDTEGDLSVHITAATADPVDFKVPIVVHNPFDESAGGGTALETSVQAVLTEVLNVQGAGFTSANALDQTIDSATLVDEICDENVVTAHGSANTVGMLLRSVGAEIAGRTYNNTLNDLLGVPDQVNATVVTEAGGGGSADFALMHSTSIATVASQVSMTLSTGSSDDDAYTNCLAIFIDQSASTQKSAVRIINYVGATRGVTLEMAPAFVVAAGDSIGIKADTAALLSTLALAAAADSILDDDATARTAAGSIGKAINTLTALGARTNNANLNSLLGVADQAGLNAVRSMYHCRFRFVKDDAAARDEYRRIRWYKDDTPLDSGVTEAKIRVINADTGVDLIPETGLLEAGTSHLFLYNAIGEERIDQGQAYGVRFKATIDGQVRVFEDDVARDTAAGS